MARGDNVNERPDDQTHLNRATYDRIAPAYAHNQRLNVASSAPLFDKLEERFVAEILPHATIADVGCGPGFDAARFTAKNIEVIGVDLSAGMLDVAATNLAGRLVQSDMRRLPFASDQLDGIWCVAALLHVPHVDTERVLFEFRRVLRRLGTLALVTAAGESSRYEEVPYVAGERRWFVYRDHETLREQLLRAGFSPLHDEIVRGNRLWSTMVATAV